MKIEPGYFTNYKFSLFFNLAIKLSLSHEKMAFRSEGHLYETILIKSDQAVKENTRIC